MQVFIIDNPPFHEGDKLLKRLKSLGLQVHYILLSHVAYIIHRVYLSNNMIRWIKYLSVQ